MEDIVIATVLIFVFFAVASVPFVAIDWTVCSNTAQEMKVDYKYKYFGGCYVRWNGDMYVPVDNVRLNVR